MWTMLSHIRVFIGILFVIRIINGCEDENGDTRDIQILPKNGVMVLNCTTMWTMKWLKEETLLLFGEDRKTNDSRISLQGNTKNLLIRNVTRADEGIYTCCQVKEDTKMVVKYNVSIAEAISFAGKSERYVSDKKGTDILLWCNITGYPNPATKWYVLQNNIRHDIGISGPLLRIKELDEGCSSDYVCVGSNDVCSSINHTMTVSLYAPPRVYIDVNEDDFGDVREYDDYLHVDAKKRGRIRYIKCTVEMNPIGHVTWSVDHDWLGNISLTQDGSSISFTKNTKYNMELGPNYEPQFRHTTKEQSEVEFEMGLTLVETSDFGLNYTCTASNLFGEDKWKVIFNLTN